MKRFVSALLSVVLLMSMLVVYPTNAYADDAERPSGWRATLTNINTSEGTYATGSYVSLEGGSYEVSSDLMQITFNADGTKFTASSSSYSNFCASDVMLTRSGSR